MISRDFRLYFVFLITKWEVVYLKIYDCNSKKKKNEKKKVWVSHLHGAAAFRLSVRNQGEIDCRHTDVFLWHTLWRRDTWNGK